MMLTHSVRAQSSLIGFATQQASSGSPIVQANLTTQGITDWRHWGINNSSTGDAKATGGGKISSFSPVGTSSVLTYANNGVAFTWTDGTPTASATSTQTGVFVGNNPSTGFTFNVAASTTTQVLYVYTGVYNTSLNFSASLSDGSVTPYTNTFSTPANIGINELYTLTFKAVSPGTTLNISILNGGPTSLGNVNLSAAALAPQSASAPEPSVLALLLSGAVMGAGIVRRSRRK